MKKRQLLSMLIGMGAGLLGGPEIPEDLGIKLGTKFGGKHGTDSQCLGKALRIRRRRRDLSREANRVRRRKERGMKA